MEVMECLAYSKQVEAHVLSQWSKHRLLLGFIMKFCSVNTQTAVLININRVILLSVYFVSIFLLVHPSIYTSIHPPINLSVWLYSYYYICLSSCLVTIIWTSVCLDIVKLQTCKWLLISHRVSQLVNALTSVFRTVGNASVKYAVSAILCSMCDAVCDM